MVKLQVRRKNGTWMTVASTQSDDEVITYKLNSLEKFHKNVRAIDETGKVVDYRR